MIDTLKKLRQKIVYTRYVVQVTAIFLIEDIKDYILKGRERHNTVDNDASDSNSSKTNSSSSSS